MRMTEEEYRLDCLRKITDITIRMPNGNIRDLKRRLQSYMNELQSQGMTGEELANTVFAEFQRIRGEYDV